MTTTVPPTTDTPTPTGGARRDGMIRWLADAYEQAQRIRIETGERLRAIVQGRDTSFEVQGVLLPAVDGDAEAEPGTPEYEGGPALWVDDTTGEERDADETLDAIAEGDTLGPVPILGRTYHRHAQEERELYKAMHGALQSHVAYPWLSRVKGIGPTLACKMLARFDPTRAEYASSFWSYAGLDTVPGALYRCATCGVERSFPVSYTVTGDHKVGGAGAKACAGKLTLVVGAEVRVAKPRAAGGMKRSYDAYAKKVMYLVATSFLKSPGSAYEQHYRKHRARLEVERPHWPDGRKHLTALRIVEKLFLSHLWQVWREALGLPTPAPWIEAHGGHDATSRIEPWSMVEPEKAAKPKGRPRAQ